MDYTINLMKKHHPTASIQFINYRGHNNPVDYKCNLCGALGHRNKGKSFWQSKYACLECLDGTKQMPQSQITILKLFEQNPIMKLISFHGHNPCKVKCLRCGAILNRYAQNILKNPYFCSHCDISRSHTAMSKEDAQHWLNSIVKNEEFEILEFKNTTEKSLIRHKECGLIFLRRIYNFNISRGCPKCDRKRSKYEKIVEDYLQANGFQYSTQKRFKDCNSGRSSYDFCLYGSNKEIILIEVQGQQHYQEIDYFQESLEVIQKRDAIKEEYCKTNNIPLIIIPYWDIEKLPQYLPIEKFNDYCESKQG